MNHSPGGLTYGRLRLHAAGNCLALVEQLLGTAQLADDLLGVVAFAFHGASPGQLLPIGKLSYRKDHFWGPRHIGYCPTPKLSGVPLAPRQLKRLIGRLDTETQERDLHHSAK